MKKAIVLSGGGARGAYQIGVWKALRKLHYNYDIVTGTSVGCLNGVLMTTKEYRKALFVWRHLKYKKIFDKELKQNSNFDLVKEYAKGALFDGGMNIKNLEKNLHFLVNKRKFYRSKIDYGLITVRYPSMKAISLTKKEIKEEKLIDYLIASSTCFPVFKKKKIDESVFIDGGYFDNLPINLAVSMGATEIIAVDLKAIGLKQKCKNKDVKITYIEPRNEIGSFLNFSKQQARNAIIFGSNDTLKVFGKLDGNRFTFLKGSLSSHYNQYKDTFTKDMKSILDAQERKIIERLFIKKQYGKFLKKTDEQSIQRYFYETMEYLGTVFHLKETKIYTIKGYHKKILKKINALENLNISHIEKKMKTGDIKDLFNSKWLIKYFMVKIEQKGKKVHPFMFLFQKEFLAALYLLMIKEMNI